MINEIRDKVYSIAAKYDLFPTNQSSGGILKGILEIISEVASIVVEHQKDVEKEAYIQSASGIVLDYLVGQVGITRYPAKKTTGKIIFARNEKKDKSVKIPKNTIVKTKLNSLGKEYRYIVQNETILQSMNDNVLVDVIAEDVGAKYNVSENSITRLVNPVSGIDSIYNDAKWIMVAGSDGETDNSLRERYFAKWGELVTGSSALAYQSWARSVEGITSVVVVSMPRGYNTVDVIIATINGIPSFEKIEEVKTIIELKKPIGVDVRVLPPESKLINISIKLHFNDNVNPLKYDELKKRASEIIHAMFVSTFPYIEIFRIGDHFILDRVKVNIMNNISEVKYIEFIEPVGNVEVSSHQIAELKSLEIE